MYSGRSRASGLCAAILGLAVMAMAAPVQASSAYHMEIVDQPYQALPIAGGIVGLVNPSGSGGDTPFSVDLPFPVSFFGNSFSSLRMSPDGWVSFNMAQGSAWQQRLIPNTAVGSSEPRNIIALWWRDQFCPTGTMKMQTLGAAPARTFILEWNCDHNSSSSTWARYQLWFFENSAVFEARYGQITGTNAWTASMGIQDSGTNGHKPLSCSTTCETAQFPSNRKVVYSRPADLNLTSISTDSTIYAGVPVGFEASVTNVGSETAVGAGVRFWLSRDAVPSPDDSDLGWAPDVHDLAPGQVGTFRLVAAPPDDITIGNYFLVARAYIGGVEDPNASNNGRAIEFIEVGNPAPDITVISIGDPEDAVELGGMLRTELVLANIGNLDAQDASFSVVLSKNDVISSTDLTVYQGTVSLAARSETTVVVDTTVPASMRTGLYHIGVLVDPDWQLQELNKLNNTSASDAQLSITAPYVDVLTPERLIAEASSPWTLELEANGGDGFFEWSLESGALPPGLRLEVVRDELGRPVYTTIRGTPTATGHFSFTLRVRSAEWTDIQIFTVEVAESGMILAFVSEKLPSASYDVPYEGRLLAVGGSAPYHWSITAGALPPGISLSASGLLSGTPEKDGVFTFDVRVEDLVGRTADGTVQVVVGPPGELVCRTNKLPAGKVGQEIAPTQLIAAGGVAPYSFESRETRRLANGTTDAGAFFVGQPPPGLSMTADGMVSGAPKAAGQYVWAVEAMDARKDRKNCLIEMVVTYEQGPAILTTALHDGFVDTPYSVQLEQFGADEPAIWGLAPGNRLPDGLALSPDGIISGMPSLTSLEGESMRIFPFVVQVKDDANRLATESLSIRIYREPNIGKDPKRRKVDEGGECQAAGGEFSLLALVASAAAGMRRRRKSDT